MKRNVKAIAASMCALAAFYSVEALCAQDQVLVQVIGSLTPSACDMEIKGGGLFYFDGVSIDQLNKNEKLSTRLPEIKKDFSITCSGVASVAVKALINDLTTFESESETNGINGVPLYSIGADSAQAKEALGWFDVQLENASYTINEESKTASFIQSLSKGEWTQAGDKPRFTDILAREKYLSWSDGGNVPANGETFTSKIVVTPYILPKSKISLAERVELQGQMQIQLHYL